MIYLLRHSSGAEMLKKLTTSLAIALATTLSQTAAAVTLEAAWDVQLNNEQYDLTTGEYVPLDIPSTGQIRTRFNIQGGAATDYGNFTQTIFSVQQGVILDSSFQDKITPNPLISSPRQYSFIMADSTDHWYDYRESLNIRDGMSAFDGDITWQYEYSITITRSTEPKSGTGLDDIAFTENYLFDYITDFMNNPDEFEVHFYLTDQILEWDSTSWSYNYLSGSQRSGTFRLTSLRRVDVPEPPAIALIGAGLLSVALLRRRRIAEKAVN